MCPFGLQHREQTNAKASEKRDCGIFLPNLDEFPCNCWYDRTKLYPTTRPISSATTCIIAFCVKESESTEAATYFTKGQHDTRQLRHWSNLCEGYKSKSFYIGPMKFVQSQPMQTNPFGDNSTCSHLRITRLSV